MHAHTEEEKNSKTIFVLLKKKFKNIYIKTELGNHLTKEIKFSFYMLCGFSRSRESLKCCNIIKWLN